MEYYEARVLFDYTPSASNPSDELCLRAGESIEVRVDVAGLDEGEEGWLCGSDQRGHHGTFPANYVADARTIADIAGGVVQTRIPGHGSTAAASSNGVYNGAQAGRSAPPKALLPATNARAVVSHATQESVARTGLRSKFVQGATTEYVYGGDGKAYSDNKRNLNAGQTTVPQGSPHHGDADRLPKGWFSATLETTGSEYYYTEDGQTSWTRPALVKTAVPGDGKAGATGDSMGESRVDGGPSSFPAVSAAIL